MLLAPSDLRVLATPLMIFQHYSSVDVNNCFIAATVFTKYTDGSSGGAFDTNYITDIAFVDASYDEHRLTGLGGE